jgi:uncharacterized BrkB/YihY/UPF0761 family membrane protein
MPLWLVITCSVCVYMVFGWITAFTCRLVTGKTDRSDDHMMDFWLWPIALFVFVLWCTAMFVFLPPKSALRAAEAAESWRQRHPKKPKVTDEL